MENETLWKAAGTFYFQEMPFIKFGDCFLFWWSHSYSPCICLYCKVFPPSFFSDLSECQVFWLDALTVWGWLLYMWRYRNLVLFFYRWIHIFPVKEAIISSMYISVNISKSCDSFCRDWCLCILLFLLDYMKIFNIRSCVLMSMAL